MHFQVVTLPLPFFPFRAHHTLNSNTCCCSALISSYMLYANTVSHHSVLLGSVSRVGLMVRCFKNSLSVRTENNSSTLPLYNLLTILWASSKLPAAFYRDVGIPLRESSHGNKHYFKPYIHDSSMLKSPYTHVLAGKKSPFFFFLFSHYLPTFLPQSRKPTLTLSNLFLLFHHITLTRLPSVGQQPSGRPEEKKPLSVSQ